ncbi:MAG TPA: septal ring lytic transglycosylase RlpA family protein, partial [Desulfatiglandales bacterium]|nr:septal ring lytic transglycosylase RlpA family protein [Desulfatiglandales bacterium]
MKRLFVKKSIIYVFIAVGFCSCAGYNKQIKVGEYKESAVVLTGKNKPYSVNGVMYYPLPTEEGFAQEGMASWYGKEFHGRRAANGEVFNMYAQTAAHKTLPFGTYVKVENLSNQKEVVVRITDRGPFIKDRILDLSYGAARDIGLINPGVTEVRLVALSEEVGKVGSGNNSKTLVKPKDFK